MARKKIIYVIVEGPSDDEALGVILNRLYDKNAVYVESTHGDITSSFSVVGDFKESWEFIKEGKHSLERHTNLGICFKKIREERTANPCVID